MSDQDVPITFESFEEMEAHLKETEKKSLTPKKNRDKTTPPEKADTDISILTSVGLELPPEQVFQVIHVYQRPGESFTDVKKVAKDEASYKNNNVRILAHDHSYGELCGGKESKCRVIIGSEEAEVS